jgi:hypothetical protein
MNKVYLLLRSNQQNGPFSLDELLQFDLKPHDLVWVEGRSAGWYYPQEIEALRPHLSFLKKSSELIIGNAVPLVVAKPSEATAKKIFVSMPATAVAKEAPVSKESAPQASSFEKTEAVFSKQVQPDAEEVKTTYAKSLGEVETDYMNWAYQKTTKKKTAATGKGMLIACLLVAVAAFAWWGLQSSENNNLKETVATQSTLPVLQSEVPAEDNLEPETATETEEPVSFKKQKTQKVITVSKQTLPKQLPHQASESTTNLPSTSANKQEPVPVATEEASSAPTEKAEPVTAEAPKEKKKLREKIADLFKKNPTEKGEEAKPVEEENGRRQATRREAGSSLVQMVAVKFDIPNDWMMGINGAKATLSNRSSEVLAKAVVEVVYYNDDNDVLMKKTIFFANIKSKQSQTVSVPDHQTATRLEYNIISATGVGEPMAFR